MSRHWPMSTKRAYIKAQRYAQRLFHAKREFDEMTDDDYRIWLRVAVRLAGNEWPIISRGSFRSDARDFRIMKGI